MRIENENQKRDPEVEASVEQDDGGRQEKPRPGLSYYFGFIEGPWTEADQIWFEIMTGEYDWQSRREADL